MQVCYLIPFDQYGEQWSHKLCSEEDYESVKNAKQYEAVLYSVQCKMCEAKYSTLRVWGAYVLKCS